MSSRIISPASSRLSWSETGVYIPFSEESSCPSSEESSTYSPPRIEEKHVYIPCERTDSTEETFIPPQQVEKIYIPYSPEKESKSCSEHFPPHENIDLEGIFAHIEEYGERYVKKIKRTQRTHTRIAIDEILAAKEDAIEEIKNCSLDIQEGCKEDKTPDEEIEKLRQEVDRLKNTVNMLSQVLFRNATPQTPAF